MYSHFVINCMTIYQKIRMSTFICLERSPHFANQMIDDDSMSLDLHSYLIFADSAY